VNRASRTKKAVGTAAFWDEPTRAHVRIGRQVYHLDKLDPNGEVTDLAAALGGSLENDPPQGQTILLVSDGIHDGGGGAASGRRRRAGSSARLFRSGFSGAFGDLAWPN
jgi:hypothetical protein